MEAWMRRVPDDPGALLRAKFQLENERRKRKGDDARDQHARALVTAGTGGAVAAAAALAWAQPRAWLDRDRIAMGDTVTLNVESDQGAPDFTPLRTDFDLSGQTSSHQVEWSNGSMQQRNLYGVALTPAQRCAGGTGPAGGQCANRAADAAGRCGPWPDLTAMRWPSSRPLSMTIRRTCSRAWAWWCACISPRSWPPASWCWTPGGASLQRVGDDRTDVRQVNGRRYNVVERRFLLIPRAQRRVAAVRCAFQRAQRRRFLR